MILTNKPNLALRSLFINKRHWVVGLFLTAVILVVVLGRFWVDDTPSVVEKSDISINTKGQRVYQGKPFTGLMISRFASGQQATADQFVNGRRHGPAKKWFKNGVLGYESFYGEGQREGYSRSWWVNGNPRSEFFYIAGKTEGVGWRWYRTGAKFKRFNYQAGQPIGLQQAWRENGKLSSNFEYKNGRTYGLKKANSCVGLENEVISPDYYQSQASSTL